MGKKVIFGKEPEGVIAYCNNVKQLKDKYMYIGMVSSDKDKYMIINTGHNDRVYDGLAVNSKKVWSSVQVGTGQEDIYYENCTFYVFDTNAELLEWMKG